MTSMCAYTGLSTPKVRQKSTPDESQAHHCQQSSPPTALVTHGEDTAFQHKLHNTNDECSVVCHGATQWQRASVSF